MTRHPQPDHTTAFRILTSVVMCSTLTGWAATIAAPAEPNVEVASAWWPEMENTWVPIGWKEANPDTLIFATENASPEVT